METRLREAPGYVAYMKGLVDRRAGDLAVKERVVQHLLDDLGRISDPLLQELYSKELCRSFALTEATVVTALRNRTASSPVSTNVVSEEQAPSGVSARLQEARRGLLRLGLTGPEWGARVVEEFEPEDFAPGPEQGVLQALGRAGSAGRWRDFVESREDDSFGTQIEIEGPFPGDPGRLFQDFRTCILETRLDAETAEVERRMQEAENQGDADAVRKLAEARQVLARDRNSLRAPMTRQGDASGGS